MALGPDVPRLDAGRPSGGAGTTRRRSVASRRAADRAEYAEAKEPWFDAVQRPGRGVGGRHGMGATRGRPRAVSRARAVPVELRGARGCRSRRPELLAATQRTQPPPKTLRTSDRDAGGPRRSRRGLRLPAAVGDGSRSRRTGTSGSAARAKTDAEANVTAYPVHVTRAPASGRHRCGGEELAGVLDAEGATGPERARRARRRR